MGGAKPAPTKKREGMSVLRCLQPEAGPEGAFLEGGQHGGRPGGGLGGTGEAEATAPAAALRRDDLDAHALAEALLPRRAQLADSVGEAERHGALAGPELAAEQIALLALQPVAAAFGDHRLEG